MDINELAILASTSFVIGFSGALVPGPLFVVTVMESTKRGYIAGPLIVIGHAITEALNSCDILTLKKKS